MRRCVTVEGTITDVDEDTFTVAVTIGKDEIDGGATFYDIPMMCLPSVQASVIQVPAMNSDCHISFLDNSLERPQLVRVNRVTKYLIGDQTDQVQVVVNGGMLKGVPKVIDLTERLNLIENAVNGLITAYNLHTHPVISVGSPTGPTVPDTTSLTPTQVDDIANPKFTQ